MKTRFVSALLALALPLAAQEPAPSPTEALFYKAFYLEEGQMDYAGAMVLYEQFLAQAPEHALAARAAKQQFRLLDRTGKTKERDAFQAKYAKLLGDVAAAGERPARPGAGRGDAPGRGDGAGRGQGRPDPAARVAELEKQLAEAKEAGDDERVQELEQQLQRVRQAGERGRGAGGRPGLFSDKKLADMSDEELGQLKDGIGRMEPMVERIRERQGDEVADKLATNLTNLKRALDAKDLEGAQKALDTLRESMPRRQRGNRGEGGGGDGGDDAGGRGRGRNRGDGGDR